jgi:hypothetical protein
MKSQAQIADDAIEDLNECIDVEKQIVEKEHYLYIKLKRISEIYGHVLGLIPDEEDNDEIDIMISDKLDEIVSLLENDEMKDLNFEKEEEIHLNKLKRFIKNHNWKLVRKHIDEEESKGESILKMELVDLRTLHNKLAQLLNLMRKSRHFDSIDKEEKDEQEYYFSETYKFVRVYEAILGELYQKEKELTDKIEEHLK